MKIAILLSGRIKCYESCLIPLLKKSSYQVDVFASVNDVENEYYDLARKNLYPWLKEMVVNPFSLSERFEEIFININTLEKNPKPYNPMSMFFNDRKSFELATNYADKNNFEYDAYLKYRSDIITSSLPDIQKSENYEIFSVVPLDNYIAPIVVRNPVGYNNEHWVPWVSDAIAYGNRESMKSYTETYNFCMEMMELFEGKYPCNFEPSVTQNAYDKQIKINYFNKPYTLDSSRHQ